MPWLYQVEELVHKSHQITSEHSLNSSHSACAQVMHGTPQQSTHILTYTAVQPLQYPRSRGHQPGWASCTTGHKTDKAQDLGSKDIPVEVKKHVLKAMGTGWFLEAGTVS